MADASDRGWGAPGEAMRPNIVKAIVGKDRVAVPVHRLIAPIVATLFARLEAALGRPIKQYGTWGFAPRKIRDSNAWSNHAWGLAADIEAPSNPMASKEHHRMNGHTYPGGKALVSNMPQNVQAIANSLGFKWGGEYPNRPDPMHFEYMGTPQQAQALVARLKVPASGGGTAPPKPSAKPPAATKDARIRELQSLLGVKADGDIGPKTEAAMSKNLIGWQVYVDNLRGRHVSLVGNGKPALVNWLRRQADRQGLKMVTTGAPDGSLNHYIVVKLGQKDGIAGPNAYKKALV